MATKKIERPVFNNPMLNITVNPDGTVKRNPEPRNPPDPDPNTASTVLSRDAVLDTNKKTWIRLYLPKSASPQQPSPAVKLPLIFYYHGGGFIFYNADTAMVDVFCRGLAESLGALVISLEYRLAPEHRLPAAYEDAVDALFWVKNAGDEWIANYADLSNCYLAGTSAGGNLAYHAGLRFAAAAGDLEPLKVRGLVLHHPYFSGSNRTESELKLADDPLLPLQAIDRMFDLSLPEGADHDHEYCNPAATSFGIEEMRRLGVRVLVTGCFDDPLVDAGLGCAKMLEEKGVETVRFFEDGYHAMELFDPTLAPPLYNCIKDFVGVGKV